MDLQGLGRLLLGAGVLLALAGLILMAAPRLPGLRHLGRLPGDILIERGSTTIYVPIVTSILLSLLLTLVLNAIFRR
jgi:hypothetical protein